MIWIFDEQVLVSLSDLVGCIVSIIPFSHKQTFLSAKPLDQSLNIISSDMAWIQQVTGDLYDPCPVHQSHCLHRSQDAVILSTTLEYVASISFTHVQEKRTNQ